MKIQYYCIPWAVIMKSMIAIVVLGFFAQPARSQSAWQQYQAEDGSWSNADVEKEHSGYTGTGTVTSNVAEAVPFEGEIPDEPIGWASVHYLGQDGTTGGMPAWCPECIYLLWKQNSGWRGSS